MPDARPPVPHLGPFRLLRPLGQGGFAPVWLAEEAYSGKKCRDVAIKLFALPARLSRSPEEVVQWRERILEEARALCRVEHPNIVRFYSLQRDDEHDVIGLAMEYVSGPNLHTLLSERGRFEERMILDIGVDVAWALAAVHNAGLVHRDVKPGNIIQGALGYKLIDFGIVVDAPAPVGQARAAPSPSDTAPPLVGTLGYIAPECFKGNARPTPASDLYSLGATLHGLKGGRLPDDTPGKITKDAGSLASVIAHLLDPDPSARPWHADWVARRLEQMRAELDARRMPAKSPALDAVLRFDHRSPLPLAPLFAAIRRARQREDAADAGRALGELGLGVLRYGFVLGMAAIAAAPGPLPAGALVERLQSVVRPAPSSWCYLVSALQQALASIEPSLAASLAFVTDPELPERLVALLRSATPAMALEERAGWIASLLDDAADLLSLRICVPAADITVDMESPSDRDPDRSSDHVPSGGPYLLLDDRRLSLSAWLPHAGGRLLLPEAPAAPGKPWRATDPESGERREDPVLDEAVRSLIRKDAEIPREPCAEPPLVGRADVLAALDRAAREVAEGSVRIALLTGPLGIGRTRLLDAAVDQADVDITRALRARCSPERRSPLRPLLRALDALPDLGDGELGVVKAAIERALTPEVLPGGQRGDEALEGVEDALLWAAAEAPVVLAIDDIQWADAQTLVLLSLLVERAELGATARLFVVVTARDEPNPSSALRALLRQIRGKVRAGIKHFALGPLEPAETAALGQAICPLHPALEQAVVRGSGGVPFFVLHALSVWRERGSIAWRDGAWRAVDDRVLREQVPGAADLVEDRLASYFEPDSPPLRAALDVLAAVALYGEGLGIDIILRIGGEGEGLDKAIEVLLATGILTAPEERQEYSFAQEMLRQAVLNLVRPRPWFYRLHRALLEVIAAGPSADADAAFLAQGYEKLGFRDKACVWLERAMEVASAAGLFPEAAASGDQLAALTADPAARLDVELSIVRVLVQGRQFEEAKGRLARIDARAGVLSKGSARGRAQDVRRRIRKLEVARGMSEAGEDPTLLVDADALADPVLRCEARMALAGVAREERALLLAGEAVALAESCGAAVEFAARVLRVELCYAAGRHALPQAAQDLEQALALAVATSSTWQQLHVEGDLAVIEGELGRVGAAIERLSRLVEHAEALGMRGQLRLLCHSLSTGLMRDGRAEEAALAAKRAADLSAEAGDPKLRAAALSLRAYALRHTGDLYAALSSADEAERLQRARDERRRAYTLLRRAEIKGALGREDDAMADAREARDIAEQYGDRWSAVTATLWQKLHLASRGEATREDVARALAEVEEAGVQRRVQTQSLVEQAAAWLRSSTDPVR